MLSMMLSSGIPGQPSPNMTINDVMHQLSREANAEHDKFQRGGVCEFAEVDDLEIQMLKPQNIEGCGRGEEYQLRETGTSIGLENFKSIYRTSNASESLDASFFAGTVAQGQSPGTGNQLFGENGTLSCTFAYWGRVLTPTASLDLVQRQHV